MPTRTTTANPQSPARRRILDTAHRLFYAEGIHTVGIDRIIAEAGVAKATFYHHFPAKDDLVCDYLTEQSEFQRNVAAQRRASGASPQEILYGIFDFLAELGCNPDFHGCAFLNAAAQYSDPDHPVRLVVADHRRWFRGLLYDLLVESGHATPDLTADLLHNFRDGLVIASHLDDPATVRSQTHAMLTRLLTPA